MFAHKIITIKFVFLASLISVGAYAAPRVTTKERISPFKTTPVTLDVAAGVAVISGSSLPGINFGINTRVANAVPLYFSVEGSAYFDTVGRSGAIIPLLLGSYVDFALSDKVHPSLGLLVGPSFAVGGATQNSSNFSMLFRPGVNFTLANNVGLNLQARFGVIGSNFVVIPQLGTAIALD